MVPVIRQDEIKASKRGRCSMVERTVISILTSVMLLAVFHTMCLAQTQIGSSPFSPASVGVPTKGIIECGEGYTSHELYDAKITLLEVMRGEKAWDLVKRANASNLPPKMGSEYVLARIRFDYFARGAPGNCSHLVQKEQFTAFSIDGEKYEPPSVVVPKPELSGRVHSGKSLEGWVAFLVPKSDGKLLMSFSADPTGAVQHGGNVWFQLY